MPSRDGMVNGKSLVIDDVENLHRGRLETLVDRFGEHRREEITGMYNARRCEMEADAKLPDFIPLFVYRHVDERCRAMYDEDYR
jgi:hypothetical protein